MSVVAQVRRTIETRGLFARGTAMVVACSGGPDSAALLLCLARLSEAMALRLFAASVDHGLRAGSAADVAVARGQAELLGVPFRALEVRVAPGASTHAQARKARYRALHEHAREVFASHVAVGHTRDDQAETVLSRIVRGSGVRGLGAIAPARADGVVRPLIDCDRAAVHALAREHFPAIARDPSNDDPRYERARVRRVLLPLLAAERPDLPARLARLADDARASSAALDLLAEQALRQAAPTAESLQISDLRGMPEALRHATLRAFLLAHALEAPSCAHLLQLDRLVQLGRGEVWLRHGLSLCATQGGALRVGTQRARHGTGTP